MHYLGQIAHLYGVYFSKKYHNNNNFSNRFMASAHAGCPPFDRRNTILHFRNKIQVFLICIGFLGIMK